MVLKNKKDAKKGRKLTSTKSNTLKTKYPNDNVIKANNRNCYMNLYVHIYIYIYTHMYIYTHIHAYIYACMHACIHTHVPFLHPCL